MRKKKIWIFLLYCQILKTLFIEKFYIFDCRLVTNPTNLTIKTSSGTGFTCDSSKIFGAYADGTNLNEISLKSLYQPKNENI